MTIIQTSLNQHLIEYMNSMEEKSKEKLKHQNKEEKYKKTI